MRSLDALGLPLEGCHLIEASAGTGKTYTISTLFLRQVLEASRPVDQILVLTFTRAATAELGERLRGRLREARAHLMGVPSGDAQLVAMLSALPDPLQARQRLDEAIESIDAAPVLTLHSFCRRTLQQFAFESGARFELDFMPEQDQLVNRTVEDWWVRTTTELAVPLAAHLLQHHGGLSGLRTLAHRVNGSPDMPVRPALTELPPTGPVLEGLSAWAQAWEQAARVWASTDYWSQVHRPLDNVGIRLPYSTMPRLAEFLTERPLGVPGKLGDEVLRLDSARLIEQLRPGRTLPQLPLVEACEALVRVHARATEVADAWCLALQRRMVDEVRDAVGKAKARTGLQTFSDQLHDLRNALADPQHGESFAARLAQRFPIALIDEFQDTDPVQYEIFARIYRGRGGLFLIGDPKQAIYGFRNADVFAYLQAAQSDQVDEAWTLDTNWRSDPGLISAVNHLFVRHERPFLVRGIEARAVQPRPGARAGLLQGGAPVAALELAVIEGRPTEIDRGRLSSRFVRRHLDDRIAGEVLRLLQAGQTLPDGDLTRPLAPGDIAVLTATKRQARQLHAALQARGIPAALRGNESVLQTDTAKDVLRLLHALANPHDAALMRSALTIRALGRNARQLQQLEDDATGWSLLVERFQSAHGMWRQQGVLAALRWLVEVEGVPARLTAQLGGARELTNLLHIGELLQSAASDYRLGPEGLLQWLDDAVNGPKKGELQDDEVHQVRMAQGGGAVQLMTIHSSKGLEFAVVVLPFLALDSARPHRGDARWPRFHDQSSHRLTMDLGGPQHEQARQAQEREQLAERVRLLYVALTRARHHCLVFTGRFRKLQDSALAWLLHGTELPGDDPFAELETLSFDDDHQLRQQLEQIAAPCGQHIRVRPVGETFIGRWSAPLQPIDALQPPVPVHPVPEARRIASYSSLLRAGLIEDGELRDHHAPPLPLLPTPQDGAPVRLASFPRGAAPGTLLHAVLEHADFAELQSSLIEEQLIQHGFDPVRWSSVLLDGLQAVLSTPLGPEEVCLAQLTAAQRLDELPFLMPVRRRGDPLTAAALAAPFIAHPSGLPPGYGQQLARLAFEDLEGFLTGFVDLIFEHDGRFFVVDYKSNHLGDTAADYAPDRLDEPMAHHHYILQAHLYVVALHRFLALRMPGYDMDLHLGGIRYLFLRGMDPGHPVRTGVWHHEPPTARIRALDAALSGEVSHA